MNRLVIAVGMAATLCVPLSLHAQQGAMVRGRVVDGEGNPLGGVRITFEHLGGTGKSFEVETKKDGKYIRVGLPAGPYKVSFAKEGFGTGTHDLTFDFGALTELPRVVLKPVREQTLPASPPPAPGGGRDAENAPSMTLSDAFREAVAATRRGETDEARELYLQILAVQPDLPEAHYNLGSIYRAEKAWAEAESAFRKVIELEPDNADAYTALAALYEDSGRSGEALDVLEGEAERFSDDADFQFNLGVMMLNANRNDAAEAAFRRSVELTPSPVESHYYLGTLAIGRGQVTEAVEHLELYVAGSGQNPRNLATAKQLLESLPR